MAPGRQTGMSAGALYDEIGRRYSGQRSTDSRIAARIWAALGDARTVLNVGAGTGSYEPPDREVIAVEPSAVMRAQRPQNAVLCLAAPASSRSRFVSGRRSGRKQERLPSDAPSLLFGVIWRLACGGSETSRSWTCSKLSSGLDS